MTVVSSSVSCKINHVCLSYISRYVLVGIADAIMVTSNTRAVQRAKVNKKIAETNKNMATRAGMKQAVVVDSGTAGVRSGFSAFQVKPRSVSRFLVLTR